MQREIFYSGKAMPAFHSFHSLAINLFTEMIFIDYAVHHAETPSEWPKNLAEHLSDEERQVLDSIRSILAHGWVLRDFVIKKFPEQHPVHSQWDSLIKWLGNLTDEEIIELTIDGIVSGLNYYKDYLKPIKTVEAILKEIEGTYGEENILLDPNKRSLALQALLHSWQVENVEETANIILNPFKFRSQIVIFIKTIWEKGYKEEWDALESNLVSAIAGQSLMKERMTGKDMVIRVTGLEPEKEAIKLLNEAKSIVFVPCLHLNKFLSIFSAGSRCFVLFDPTVNNDIKGTAVDTLPSQYPDLISISSLVEAIGDPTRLKILLLLKDRPGLHTIQIAEQLEIHQSTVSRNCQQLVKAGIISIQKNDSFKCFYINQGWAEKLSEWLLSNFGS